MGLVLPAFLTAQLPAVLDAAAPPAVDKRQERLMKNRQAADLSRKRKRQQAQVLEQSFEETQKENARLRLRVGELEHLNKALIEENTRLSRKVADLTSGVASAPDTAMPSGPFAAVRQQLHGSGCTAQTRTPLHSGQATGPAAASLAPSIQALCPDAFDPYSDLWLAGDMDLSGPEPPAADKPRPVRPQQHPHDTAALSPKSLGAIFMMAMFSLAGLFLPGSLLTQPSIRSGHDSGASLVLSSGSAATHNTLQPAVLAIDPAFVRPACVFPPEVLAQQQSERPAVETSIDLAWQPSSSALQKAILPSLPFAPAVADSSRPAAAVHPTADLISADYARMPALPFPNIALHEADEQSVVALSLAWSEFIASLSAISTMNPPNAVGSIQRLFVRGADDPSWRSKGLAHGGAVSPGNWRRSSAQKWGIPSNAIPVASVFDGFGSRSEPDLRPSDITSVVSFATPSPESCPDGAFDDDGECLGSPQSAQFDQHHQRPRNRSPRQHDHLYRQMQQRVIDAITLDEQGSLPFAHDSIKLVPYLEPAGVCRSLNQTICPPTNTLRFSILASVPTSSRIDSSSTLAYPGGVLQLDVEVVGAKWIGSNLN
ncbi:hypothetical protein HK105_204454 [Polyrhizophydium stewartii]|uniref:BZIP domain-containing protein n=1 Tax=Polyrhizophydium stewartii TaxID=2732419 RepID=A0ABR4N928_9FUNG|nr:hypothetical protein HK105_008201 [Polyrhizophydium stewartii]